MPPSEDSIAAHSRDSFRSSAKRKLSGIISFSAPGVEASHNLVASDADYQTKRQKTSPFLQSSNLQDSMSKVSVVAGRDLNFGHANFQPYSGVKKLVVKNLRKTSPTNLQDHYDGIFQQLALALNCIFNGQRPRQPLERLYRNVEDICRNDQAELLYNHLKNACRNHLENGLLQPILLRLRSGFVTLDTLRSVRQVWQSWSSQSVCLALQISQIVKVLTLAN